MRIGILNCMFAKWQIRLLALRDYLNAVNTFGKHRTFGDENKELRTSGLGNVQNYTCEETIFVNNRI